ncbi:MAG: hypothetical protein IMZ71_00995 [Chloroflexi bacterium]|nr:hypothetical protein [Chloroflexota bacterium]
MKQATLKNPSKMKKLSQAPSENLPKASKALEAERKGRFLNLEVMRSSGDGQIFKDEYVVDGFDLLQLLDGAIPFIEIPTQKTPGIRFITLTYEK